jgi:DNA polymerase-3 subunit beta
VKLTIARGELAEALSSVSRGLSSRSTLPILSGILVTASDSGAVVLQATDLEVSVRVEIEANVETAGQAVFPGKLTADIVRSLPEAAVTIALETDLAVVTCEQSSFTVRTLSPEDFPRFPQVDDATVVEIATGALEQATNHVARAVSRDETRPILTGVLVSIDGPSLKMVATDSYRLAVKELTLETPAEESVEVVVPGRALIEVARLSSDADSVSVGVAENQVVFEFAKTTFITRRIEGSFPNYRQLIPSDTETSVRLPKEEISQAVKRVALLAQHNSPVRLTVSSEDQTLSLSATTQDVGDASEDLMAAVEGPDVEIAFNHAFLVDGVAVAGGDEVVFDIVSPLKPGVLTAPEDEGFLYLLMPVRLG